MRRGAIWSTRAATAGSLRQVSCAAVGSGPCQTDPVEISGRSTCSQGQSEPALAVPEGGVLFDVAPGLVASDDPAPGAVLPGAFSCASASADVSASAATEPRASAWK